MRVSVMRRGRGELNLLLRPKLQKGRGTHGASCGETSTRHTPPKPASGADASVIVASPDAFPSGYAETLSTGQLQIPSKCRLYTFGFSEVYPPNNCVTNSPGNRIRIDA